MAIEDKVNEILGIEQPKASKEEFKAPVPRKEEKEKTDIDNDHKYSRENYYNLIEKGQEAIEGILNVAKEGEHPELMKLQVT